MSYVDISLHAGHDGSLCILASDDISGSGDTYVHRMNRLTTAGWTGWQQFGGGPGRLELRRCPDGRLLAFGWPDEEGRVSVRMETAVGSGFFYNAQRLSYSDPNPVSAHRGFLVRGLSDGRVELFIRTEYRAYRSLQTAPGGTFGKLVDLDGSEWTPAERLLCVAEDQHATPLLWGVDAAGNLRGAAPSSNGSWAWGRSVDYPDRVGAAYYVGQRGPHELFSVTDRHELLAHRFVDLPFPQPTLLKIRPTRMSGAQASLSDQHLQGHYSGDGRLYLFAVARGQGDTGTPFVVAETSAGSAWQPNGAGWSPILTPPVLAPAQRVDRICASSFHVDGRLACAALFEDGTIRVSTQASLGSTSWSAWGLV